MKLNMNIYEIFNNRTLIVVFMLIIGVALVAYGHSDDRSKTRSPFAMAIGFAFVAMGALLLGLRYLGLEKKKRKVILIAGICFAVTLVVILLFGGPRGHSSTPPLPAELAAWHEEGSSRWNNGLSADSVRWRFTRVSSLCECEVEIKLAWQGTEELAGTLDCCLLDADGYEIAHEKTYIKMPPHSKKAENFSFGILEVGREERAIMARKLQLRFEDVPGYTQAQYNEKKAQNEEIEKWVGAHPDDPDAQKYLELTQPSNKKARKHGEPVLPPKWKVKANWRALRTGMSQYDVRELLGEPDKVTAFSDKSTCWYYDYPGGGRIEFEDGKVESWSEP